MYASAYEPPPYFMIKKLSAAYRRAKYTNTSPLRIMLGLVKYKLLYNKPLLPHPHALILGVRNIHFVHQLTVGLNNTGSSHPRDKTVVNVEGVLNIGGRYSIGRGCRIFVRKGAVVSIGANGYMNNDTEINIAKSLTIGSNVAIGWKCQFLDSDLHHIEYEGKKPGVDAIEIGNNVWIGCYAHIYRGTVIADNCVIAADAVVRGRFDQPNCLIGGNPARVLRTDINWRL